MFEDLVPSAQAQTPAPPPGLFDDLIPTGGAKSPTAAGVPSDDTPEQVPSGLTAAITDIPREMAASTRETWENLRHAPPSSLGGERNMATEGPLESLGRTGKGLLAAAALPFAPVQGVGRSLIGHSMVAADQALRRGAVGLYGEDKVRAAEQATGQTPGGMTYDEARRNADILLSLNGPRGGLAAIQGPAPAAPPLPPPPDEEPSLTVSPPRLELPPLHEGTRITGHGPLGPILEGYQGRWADALDWLRRAQTGDASGVLSHPDVPDPIDVIWGASNYGLAKIIAKHPEVVDDLPDRLARMHKISESENRIVLSDATSRAVISRNWYGDPKTWLLSAYETNPRRGRGTIGSPAGLPGPTRSSGPPGSDNVGGPPANNKIETPSPPKAPSEQQISENRAAIIDAIKSLGVPPERIDQADIDGLAHSLPRRDSLTPDAFKRAVIGDALKRGFVTPEEVEQIYGKGAADEYRGPSTPANGAAAPPQGPQRGEPGNDTPEGQ